MSSEADRFGVLVEPWLEMLFRLAYSVLRNPDDAQDAVQDALLKLFRTRRWNDLRNERAFLARTVWRSALDHHRSRSSTIALDNIQAAVTANAQLPRTPEEICVALDWQALLYQLVDELPVEQRAPLLLSAIDGMTTREISVALDVNENTVRTRIHRARQELKRRFETYGMTTPYRKAPHGSE